ncbi:hypothetical protein MY682_08410 [Haemophilus influenzae]|uniref:hypothetical protein n=1 Tax=Haemophilus TaxID=724 RepID=UPI001E42E3E7|nr:hypothetical protein [Haemophilus influenzae]MCK8808408.1 hypothetical protein [Haemophilus influenzae]MCK8883237.1 hypothetical protein [Haemophilus influenzae]MCK9069427.1 hypothetical protein [Haemophilus influenzae]
MKKLNAKQVAYNQYRGQVETLKNISGKSQIIGAQASAVGTTITAPIVNSIRDFMSFEDVMVGGRSPSSRAKRQIWAIYP